MQSREGAYCSRLGEDSLKKKTGESAASGKSQGENSRGNSTEIRGIWWTHLEDVDTHNSGLLQWRASATALEGEVRPNCKDQAIGDKTAG